MRGTPSEKVRVWTPLGLSMLVALMASARIAWARDVADNFSVTAATNPLVTVVQGPVVSPKNGNSYYLLSASSWVAAEAQAVSMYGHLTAIRDQAEQQWIQTTFTNGGIRDLWIGLSDAALEGTFAWVSGDRLIYTHWAAGQPDNSNASEDHAAMRGSDGAWIDLNSDAPGSIQGVVEIKADTDPMFTTFDVEPASLFTVVDSKGDGIGQWRVTNPETGIPLSGSGVVSDPAARDGKAFQIHRTVQGAASAGIWATTQNGGTGQLVDVSNGGTFVGRIRVAYSNTNRGINLYMSHKPAVGSQVHTLQVGYGGVRNWLYDLTPNPDASATGFAHDANYHILRATTEVDLLGRHNVKVYFDESVTPVIDEPNLPIPIPGVNNAGAQVSEFGFAMWNDQNPVAPGVVGDLWIDWWAGCQGVAVPPGVNHPLNAIVAKLETPTTATRCSMGIAPLTTQRLTLVQGSSGSLNVTLVNSGALPLNYTASKIDAFGNPVTYDWLTFSAPRGGLVGVNGSSPFTLNINTNGLAPGVYTGIVKFTSDCNPASSQTATIELTVVACSWTVSDNLNVWNCGGPRTYNFTVTNTSAATPLSYVVEAISSNSVTSPVTTYPWLTINTPSGGPLAPGQSQNVSVTVNSPTVPLGYVRFTADCSSPPQVREIDFGFHSGYVGPNMLSSQAYRVFSYQGDVDPISANACGQGCQFLAPNSGNVTYPGNNVSSGALVTDPDAVDGKAYTFNNIGQTYTSAGFRTVIADTAGPPPSDQNFNDGLLGTTLVARLKVLQNSDVTTNMLFMWENSSPSADSSTAIGFGGLGPAIADTVTDPNRAATSSPLGIADDAYHIFRLISGFGAYGSRTVKVFVDENSTPVLNIANAGALNFQPSDGFGFGIRDGHARIFLDWITFTNAGMYEPGQEIACLGQSLIPTGACCSVSLPGGCADRTSAACSAIAGTFHGVGTVCATTPCCPTPFADVDADHDVDLDDFGAFQRCYTGPNSLAPLPRDCLCFDHDADGKVTTSDFTAFLNCAGGANASPRNCD